MIDVKDRVPTYPGRVKLTPVSGQANTFDMVRADQPTEPGTPINRDLFNRIQNDLNYKIGDIKTTMRTDLGEKWLLCNGGTIDPEIYPELAEICRQTPENMATENKDLWGGNYNYTKINCIHYANGYWVIGGQHYNGSNYFARISYATSLEGPWTNIDLWIGTTDNIGIFGITYADNYWVVCGGGTYNLAYATDPTGTWTKRNLWNTTLKTYYANCINYANGYWVIGEKILIGNSYYARVAYTTTLNGEWKAKEIWNGTYDSRGITCIAYANGYWVIGGQFYSGSIYNARVSYATTLDGEWIIKNLMSYGGLSTINCIAYADGYWVVGGQGNGISAKIAYAETPDGVWTVKDMWGYSKVNSVNCITRAGGYWVIGGGFSVDSTYSARIAYAETPDGEWTLKDLWTGVTTDTSVRGLIYADLRWVFVGQAVSSSSYIARLAHSAKGGMLPLITGPAYTYIKALEG